MSNPIPPTASAEYDPRFGRVGPQFGPGTASSTALNLVHPPQAPMIPPPSHGGLKPRSEALAANLDIVELLRALKRRWLLAAITGPLTAVVAMIAAFPFLPRPTFVSEASLYMSIAGNRVAFSTEQANNPWTFIKTQQSLLRSQAVLGSALKDPQLKNLRTLQELEDPGKYIAEKLESKAAGEILYVSIPTPYPEDASVLTNVVVDSFLKFNRMLDKDRRMDRFNQVKDAYDKFKKSLEYKRRTIATLVEIAGSSDELVLSLKQSQVMERLQSAERELVALENDIRLNETKLRLLQERQAENPTVGAPAPAATPTRAAPTAEELDALVARNSAVQSARARVALYQSEMAKALNRARGDKQDMAYKKLAAQYEMAKQSYQSMTDDVRAKIEAEILHTRTNPNSPRYQARPEDIDTLPQVIEVSRLHADQLKDEIAKLTSSLVALANNALKLENVRNEIEVVERTSASIATLMEQMRVELDAPDRVQSLSKADVVKPAGDRLKQYKLVGMVGLGALGVVLLGIALLEFQTKRLDSMEVLDSQMGMRVIGTIPTLPRKASNQRAITRPDDREIIWEGMLRESVNEIRTHILHARMPTPPRVLMVTSGMPREGKTTLTAYLAVSLASCGHRTLLIDADLRRPMMDQLFTIPNEMGLAEVLRGDADFWSAIQPSTFNMLSLLPAGRTDAQSIEMLNHGNLQAIIQQARQVFDYVIIDTAPVLPVSDTLMIGRFVDAALFVAMRNQSRREKIYDAYERLTRFQIPMLGTVITAATASRRYYYDPYGYYGYYGYYAYGYVNSSRRGGES